MARAGHGKKVGDGEIFEQRKFALAERRHPRVFYRLELAASVCFEWVAANSIRN
jgi:hypothetical protein